MGDSLDAKAGRPAAVDKKGLSARGVFISLRPWSWTAVLIPILLVAQLKGRLLTGDCARLVFMGCFAQAAANLLNSYFDYKSGVDTKDHAGDDSILAGHITPELCLPVACILLGVATCLSWSFLLNNESFRQCFYAGVGLSYLYTGPPFPLKYYSLGDIAIFIAFGPVVMQACAAALTGELDSALYIFCVPTGLLTEAILWANNARDIESDLSAGVYTMCRAIGFATSRLLFQLMTYGAYVACAYLAWQRQAFGLLLPLLTLPLAVKTCSAFQEGKAQMEDAPERSAQLHLPFGLLMVIGLNVDCYTTNQVCTWTA